MRRLLALFVLLASAALIAATPRPRPTPSLAPLSTPTPAGAPVPVVLIYPFEAPSDLDPRYGGAIAQIYAQVMTQTGGVTVLAIPTNIKREDYDKYARVQHADYYIGGYIQPIGTGAAIVATVVDVNSEISVYSATTQINDVQDVASQALTARSIVLQAAGIDRPQIAPAPADTPTPSSTSGASVSITSALGGLFRGHAKPVAVASATPAPPKPPIGVLVARVSGNAAAPVLSVGTDDLFRAMNAHYKTALSSVSASNVAKAADAICGTHRSNTVASGVLDVTHVGGFRAHDRYTFTLHVYACFGAVLYTNTQTDDDRARAIREAVDQYYAEHPDNT